MSPINGYDVDVTDIWRDLCNGVWPCLCIDYLFFAYSGTNYL